MAKLHKIVDFLDAELRVGEFSDASNNGLQVENSGRVRRVCCGVDASLEFFEAAVERDADMLICHHGISWGDSLKTISGLNYRKIRYLIEHDLALYACHLPLDAHPRYGNNACLCRAMGLKSLEPFGDYHGVMLGYAGMLPKAMRYDAFKKRLAKIVDNALVTMDFGRKTVRSVAVVSGGAAAETEEAGRKGIDVYVSGEPGLIAYNLAREYGINAVFAGHYATEIFGVAALGELLVRRFGVEADVIRLGIPY